MIRVLVVDDNEVVRTGVTALVASLPDVEVAGEAATGRQAIEVAAEVAPDVVLLDVRMPVLDGVSAAARLSQDHKVLMLTYSDEPSVVAGALRNGASGYLVHGTFTAQELATAIRDVAADRPAVGDAAVPALLSALRGSAPATTAPTLGLRGGGHGLTPREAEVMDGIARGLSNQTIAAELFLAEKTVKNTINRIYTKLGVASRSEAIARWLGSDGEVGP
ncbi:response regulator [Egicoccus sp. AB-alg2]|uniref:response regulator n=1 Tax=Egicoccus sp. AB-alg2 TaxID=3242693 RepID=UPI00359EBF14